MFMTFFLVVVGWIIFRAESIGMAWEYFQGICNVSVLTIPVFKKLAFRLVIYIGFMLLVEWLQRGKEHGLEFSCNKLFNYWYVRWVLYILLAISCLLVSFSIGKSSFIYFQF